jgi:hypothetical protein
MPLFLRAGGYAVVRYDILYPQSGLGRNPVLTKALDPVSTAIRGLRGVRISVENDEPAVGRVRLSFRPIPDHGCAVSGMTF